MAGTGSAKAPRRDVCASFQRVLGAAGTQNPQPWGAAGDRRALALGSWPEIAGMSKWVQCGVSWPGLGAK